MGDLHDLEVLVERIMDLGMAERMPAVVEYVKQRYRKEWGGWDELEAAAPFQTPAARAALLASVRHV